MERAFFSVKNGAKVNNYKGIEYFYNLYTEMEHIKRAGWVMRNVPAEVLESVSSHTLQVVMLSITFCHELNLDFDISRIAEMSLIHDIGEVLIGDVSEIDVNYEEKKKLEENAVLRTLSTLSKETQDHYFSLWQEMEKRETLLSQFVYQVDKIDAVMKAKKYSIDYDMPELFDEFYDYQLLKGTFDEGPLKEVFGSLRETKNIKN